VIEGHTDNIGSDAYNQELSQQRADAVRGFLIQNGIGAERITAQGRGKSYPVASNDTEVGRQQNRRVEITIPR
jgi:OOP family OmpA-OmpF porin